MKASRTIAAVALLAASILSCAAPPGLSGVERRILREPVYQTASPRYGLLVLGADFSTRIWLVHDGSVLHVDRNANGDLTDEGEAVTLHSSWDLGNIDVAKGARIQGWIDNGILELEIRFEKKRYLVGYDRIDRLRFAERPEDAPVIHLGGPLTLRLWGREPRFVPGSMARLNVSLGTHGIGKGSFAALQCCTLLRHNIAPIAEIAFPHRDPDQPPLLAKATVGID